MEQDFNKLSADIDEDFNNCVRACLDFVRGEITEKDLKEVSEALNYQASEKIKKFMEKREQKLTEHIKACAKEQSCSMCKEFIN